MLTTVGTASLTGLSCKKSLTPLLLTDNGTTAKYTVAANAVVYKMSTNTDGTLDKYEVSNLGSINVADTVWLYDTKGKDADGTATYVIFKAH